MNSREPAQSPYHRWHLLGLIVLATVGVSDAMIGGLLGHFPGPENPVGMTAVLLSAGYLATICLYTAVAPRPNVSGFTRHLALASLLAALYLYRRIRFGADDTVVQIAEAAMLWGPIACGTFIIVTARLHPTWQAHDARLRIGKLAFAIVALQLSLHVLFAAPASSIAYNSIEDELRRVERQGMTKHLAMEAWVHLPDTMSAEDPDRSLIMEAWKGVREIQAEAPSARYAWAIPSPLENLPRARALILYDGSTTPPAVLIRHSETMVHSAIPYLQAHVAASSFLTILLLGAAVRKLPRRREPSGHVPRIAPIAPARPTPHISQ